VSISRLNYTTQLDLLKKSILEYSEAIHIPVSCGPDLYMCPFCKSEIEDYKIKNNEIMPNIEHFEDCVWLWAVESDKYDPFVMFKTNKFVIYEDGSERDEIVIAKVVKFEKGEIALSDIALLEDGRQLTSFPDERWYVDVRSDLISRFREVDIEELEKYENIKWVDGYSLNRLFAEMRS